MQQKYLHNPGLQSTQTDGVDNEALHLLVVINNSLSYFTYPLFNRLYLLNLSFDLHDEGAETNKLATNVEHGYSLLLTIFLCLGPMR